MCDHYRPPALACRFQIQLAPCSVRSSACSSFWRKILRIADREEHLELSAFLAILWYTCRDQRMLKFSGLIRTLVGEAMIHFLAMISMQIMSNCLRTTWGYDLSRLLHHLAISDREHSGVLADSFRFCEYGINLDYNGSQLTVSASRNEVHMGCTSFCVGPLLRTAKPTRSVASIRY